MPFFDHDSLRFHYRDFGQGLPFVFQHGLGGDVNQPLCLFRPPPGVRLLALDCRAHGQTRPLGEPEKIGFATFAEDLAAWLDEVGVSQAVVGGISMGAALALRFALRFPGRVLGLVLSRPAWLDGPNLKNAELYGRIAVLIRRHGRERGLELFRQSDDYQRVLDESPDAARSLLGQFEHPRAEETLVKLERIPHDAPCRDLRELGQIAVPALVLANHHDPIHPFEYGEALARAIPTAEFRELTAKSVSQERHAQDVQRFVSEFLIRRFLNDALEE